ASEFAQVPHRGAREVVVGVSESCPAPGGELESTGRASSAATLSARWCRSLGFARFDESVEVAAHAGGAQAEAFADLGGGDRSVFEQEPYHFGTGLSFGGVAAHGGNRACRSCRGTRELRDRCTTCAFCTLERSGRGFHNTSVTE